MPANFGPAGGSSSSGGGITSINTDTTAAQVIAVGTSGTDVAVATSSGTTTISIPNASATARGVVSTGTQTFAGTKTFSSPISTDGTGTATYGWDDGTFLRNHAYLENWTNNGHTGYFGYDGQQRGYNFLDDASTIVLRFGTPYGFIVGANLTSITNVTDNNMDIGSASKRVKGVYVTAGVVEAEEDLGNSGSGTVAINWANSCSKKVTMTGNCTFGTPTNPIAGVTYKIKLVEDATGSRVPTWFTILWPSGVAPTLSGANKTDLVNLYYDGTSYYGSFSGNY